MAKSTNSNQFEKISVSKIYDTLKSKEFLDELWHDLILDMKNKPSYMRIKDMVKQLITEKDVYFASPITSHLERMNKKTALAEISILGYTIDTVLSQVLYNKLQNEFPSFIVDMINEFKAKSSATDGDLGQNKDANDVSNKVSDAVEEKAKIVNADSDSDSDLSDCNLSICSVSSVHTSDLSSYDDEVSLSSEDEDGGEKKKRISVREASEKLFKGKIEEIHEIGKPAKRQKKEKKQKAKMENSSSSTIDLVSRKTLPTRVRKPNSKYSSEDILCPMKQFPNLDHSPASESSSPPKTLPKEIKDAPPTRKRGRPRKDGTKTLNSNHSSENILSPMKKFPNLDHSLVSEPSSSPKTLPKENKDTPPTRKRGRPRKCDSNISIQYNAAAEDLSAIEVSRATMQLQTNWDQKNSSSQSNKSETTRSDNRKIVTTIFQT